MLSRLARLPLLIALMAAVTPASAATVWFVDSGSYGGSGTEAAPFPTLEAAEAASAPGDVIFVRPGREPYRGGITLKPGQVLNAGAEARPVIDSVTAAGAATIRNVTINRLRIEEGSGDVTLVNAPIENSGGTAVVIRKRSGKIEFRDGSTVRVTGGKADAILIEDSPAEVAFRDPLTIATAGARGLVVKNGGKLSIAAASKIESTGATAVELRGVGLDGGFAAVSVSGDFERGIVLERTTGRFSVGGGTIRGARQRGVELRGAKNVTLQNLSIAGSAGANGAAPANCAENLIAGDNLLCNGAIVMHDVDNVVVDGVRIEGSGQLGVSGHDVRGATFKGLSIDGAGDELHEHGVVLEDVSGEILFTGCTIRKPASRAIFIASAKGDAAVTIEGCRFSDVVQPLGMQAVLINAFGSARIAVAARKNSFTNIYSSAIYLAAEGKSQIDAVLTGNAFDAAGGAVNLIADNGAQLKFDVSKNIATNSTAVPINVASGAGSVSVTMSGAVAGNRISGARCGGCTGISVRAGGTSVVAANVARNEIERVDGSAIWAHADKRARLDVAIETNVLREPLAATNGAIRVQAGSQPKDTAVVCARIGGSGVAANRISGSWDPRGAIQLINRTESQLRLPALASLSADDVAAYVRARNGGAAAKVFLAAQPRAEAIVRGDECSVPEIR